MLDYDTEDGDGEEEVDESSDLKARILAEMGLGPASGGDKRLTIADLSEAVQKGMASYGKQPVVGQDKGSFFTKMVGPFPVWGVALGAVGVVAACWMISALLRLRDYERG